MSPVAIIAVCAVCTLLTRALPFLLFRDRALPPAMAYLGRVLPAAIMVTLLVYCLRSISFSSVELFAPQLISCAITIALHLWKRSTLLSIAGGTVCCMLLTQLVF